MAHIVVLGAGIGGVSMAYEIRAICGKVDKVTVISDSPTFHFVPSNPWVGVNWRRRDQIEVPLEKYFARKKIDFIPVAAEKLDPAKNEIKLADGQLITYDYLILATGPELAFDEIEGLGPEGHTESVCHVDHAVGAAKNWEEFLKKPGPIVAGSAQGASCFGPAYEHTLIMDRDLRLHKKRDKVPMTFITSEPYIGHLGLGGVGDSKGLLESELRKRDIKWITNAKIDKVEDGRMFVTECDENGEPKKQHELPFSYSMVIPPFRGIKALQGIDGLVNPRGFVLVDNYQRNPTYKNIFGVGVCIAIPPLEQTPVPTGVPKTGYMIESMVKAVAYNLKEICAGREPSVKPTWNAICLADMGNNGVAFVALPQNPPRNVAWMRGGKWVHWMKIMFEWYFLRKVKKGHISPFYETFALRFMGIRKRDMRPD
ncbi:MAG: NAD(P)/FAD-dependent oxidoreductase [Rhodospirillales bacterium]|nr:NAD(P)/FAD-dependent oxidoreductase [Rhodospirillales bacterium]